MIKKIALATIIVSAFLLGCSVVEVGGKRTFFPLAEGNSWVFNVSGVDEGTVKCQLNQLNSGLYTWNTEYHYTTERPAILADGSEASDPFSDSVRLIVDSAFNWPNVGIIPDGPDEDNDNSGCIVKTPAGTFENCLLVKGKPNEKLISYDVWFAPNVGPVQIYCWKNNEVAAKYVLTKYSATQ